MVESKKYIDGKEKPLLLVAPLDWGLGHTTRVIPLIRQLLQSGCDVVVACNSTQKTVLEMEFPSLHYVFLEGYGVDYGGSRTSTRIKLLLYSRNILTKVKREQMWFIRFLSEYRVDAVISDNRYGLRCAEIPCILITHQLGIRSGWGKLIDLIANKILYRHINEFTECWVPDFQGVPNFAGKLSHPKRMPAIPVRYMGCLSRLNNCVPASAKGIGILIILSGPEPQRTIFETRLLLQLQMRRYDNITLVRGLPEQEKPLAAIPGVTLINHAAAGALNQIMCAAELIISRAGYTTIMDGLKLRRKMVVVPTPGQAEQEYLGAHLSSFSIAVSISQNDFSIDEAIRLSAEFNYRFPEVDMEQYKKVVGNFIASLFSLYN